MIRRWLLLMIVATPLLGQTTTLHLDEYLDRVAQSNLDLAANRFNVTVAEAQIALAKLRPDPQATAGIAALDLTDQKLPTATTYGLAQTIELGGKRSARIGVARAGRSLADAQLEEFFQQLRADAANAFIDALTARQIVERKRRTLESVERLVGATEYRVRAGDLSESALWQVKVEAERFRGEVFGAEGDSNAATIALQSFIGAKPDIEPAGELTIAPRTFDANALVADALAHRTELLVSLRNADVAHAQAGLAKSNRWVDPTLSAAITQAPSSAASDSPASRSLGFTVGVPIPLSRVQTRADLVAANALAEQADMQALAVRRRVEVEVRQALARYEAGKRTVGVYTSEVLANADRALEATRYSYERGNARLVELLDAQRTVDDVYLAYLGALSDNAKALVALEHAAGRWDGVLK